MHFTGRVQEVGHPPGDAEDIPDQDRGLETEGEGQGHVQVHIPGHAHDLVTEGRYVVKSFTVVRSGKRLVDKISALGCIKLSNECDFVSFT